MGCDYYICKYLLIKFQYLVTITIDIEINRCYYNFSLDKSDVKYKENVDEILNNVMDPIIIYDNNEFRSSIFETKYKDLIDNELQESSDNLEWKHIREIAIMESRFERE
jgi:hypothetical protein